jgi:hypothetical protein
MDKERERLTTLRTYINMSNLSEFDKGYFLGKIENISDKTPSRDRCSKGSQEQTA